MNMLKVTGASAGTAWVCGQAWTQQKYGPKHPRQKLDSPTSCAGALGGLVLGFPVTTENPWDAHQTIGP
jgi:hypothetical protein